MSLNRWNMFDRHVQSGLSPGQNITSGSVGLFVGPAYIGTNQTTISPLPAEAEDTDLPPSEAGERDVFFGLGTVSQWGLNQQCIPIPVPECGSHQRYTIISPGDGQFSMSKTLYHGPSLMRALHASRAIRNPSSRGGIVTPLTSDTGEQQGYPKNFLFDAPGYQNAWFNLNSDINTMAFGIMLMFEDSGREAYGAIYLEGAHMVTLGMGAQAGGAPISEQTNIVFNRVRPLKLAKVVPELSRPVHAGQVGIAGGPYTVNRTEPGFEPIITGSNR